ncbi:MAG: DnaJ domain-containing protein [Desulfococcaceae bacterium]
MRKLIFFVLGMAYTIFPGDFDFIPVLGWIDDALVWYVLYWLFFKSGFFGNVQDFMEGGFPGSEEANGEGPKSGAKEKSRRAGTSRSRQTGPRSPHEVLGVPRGASKEEIRHAYRELANKYHPDKVAHLGDEFQKLAEKRFKEIQEAYQTLAG